MIKPLGRVSPRWISPGGGGSRMITSADDLSDPEFIRTTGGNTKDKSAKTPKNVKGGSIHAPAIYPSSGMPSMPMLPGMMSMPNMSGMAGMPMLPTAFTPGAMLPGMPNMPAGLMDSAPGMQTVGEGAPNPLEGIENPFHAFAKQMGLAAAKPHHYVVSEAVKTVRNITSQQTTPTTDTSYDEGVQPMTPDTNTIQPTPAQ